MVNVMELRKWSGLLGVLGISVGGILGPTASGMQNTGLGVLGWGALVAGLVIFFFPVLWIPWHEKCIKAEAGCMAEILVAWVDYGDGVGEMVIFAFPELDQLEIPETIEDLSKKEQFRKFVRWESLNNARISKIGNPILPKILCPNGKCGVRVDAGTEICPSCGTALPKLPDLMIPRQNWKTPEKIQEEISQALKKVKTNGGITVCRGKLRRPWVRMDGRDWYEKCSIVIPHKTDWDIYFGKPIIMPTPFYEMGMIVEIKCHYANLEKICNSEAGVPIFMVKDSAWAVHQDTQKMQEELKNADTAINTLVALNGAENKDVVVVQERQEKQEAKNLARFWQTKYTLKQIELDTVTGQHIRLPNERSNRTTIALFVLSLLSTVFACLSIWQFVA